MRLSLIRTATKPSTRRMRGLNAMPKGCNRSQFGFFPLSRLKILAETWRFPRWMIRKNRPGKCQLCLQTGDLHIERAKKRRGKKKNIRTKRTTGQRNLFLITAGLPAARQSSGISRMTTDPAAMTQRLPIDTPGHTITPPPSHVSSPMVMG